MTERTYTISFRIDAHYLSLLEREASKMDAPTEKRGRGRKPKKVSVHAMARKLCLDALEDAERERLLAGQEFLANRLEGLSEEMQREFEALREDLESDFSKVIELVGQQKGR
jgi:hypothetical protein